MSDAEAAAIRAAFDRGGEFSAAVELRRLFPGVTDTAKARECARAIAAWKPRNPAHCPVAVSIDDGGAPRMQEIHTNISCFGVKLDGWIAVTNVQTMAAAMPNCRPVSVLRC